MAKIDFDFVSTPAGSIGLQPIEQHELYLQMLGKTPPSIKSMLTALRTGAYIRGLTRIYNIPLEVAPKLAFAILLVGVGAKKMVELPALLSTNLQLANDKAQIIAQEIERELFTPIMLDFNESLKNLKSAPKQATLGTQNVLNLKQMKPPVPPQR